jgi:hypothetical protein
MESRLHFCCICYVDINTWWVTIAKSCVRPMSITSTLLELVWKNHQCHNGIKQGMTYLVQCLDLTDNCETYPFGASTAQHRNVWCKRPSEARSYLEHQRYQCFHYHLRDIVVAAGCCRTELHWRRPSLPLRSFASGMHLNQYRCVIKRTRRARRSKGGGHVERVPHRAPNPFRAGLRLLRVSMDHN